MWGGRLRERAPKRTDPELTTIADALPGDILRYIALIRKVMPVYNLRPRRKRLVVEFEPRL